MSIEEVCVPLLQDVESGDTGDFSCCHAWSWPAELASHPRRWRGGSLPSEKFAILALHDLQLLVKQASRQLLLAAGTLVKRHPTHGSGLQHGAESVNQFIGRFLMACKVNAWKLLAKLGNVRLAEVSSPPLKLSSLGPLLP